MPPKRQSTGSSSMPAKKSKTSAGKNANENTQEPELPYSTRWAPVSGSRNADNHYKHVACDPAKAFSFVCLCRIRFEGGQEEEMSSCDGGKSCPCLKPATEHPDHVYTITAAGLRKFSSAHIMLSLRDPDAFGIDTYNDYFGTGILEVAQNLLRDFDEAQGNWKEQWAICEGSIMFFQRDATEPLLFFEDGDAIKALCQLFATMFLTMLATLETVGLLKTDSEVKNLGVIMAAYLLISDGDLFDNAMDLGSNVLAYATKHNINLGALPDMEDWVEGLQPSAEKAELPESGSNDNDPWEWKKSLQKYCKSYVAKQFGGDALDITTWTSAERKKHSFDGKDPLTRKMISTLKEGLVMQLA